MKALTAAALAAVVLAAAIVGLVYASRSGASGEPRLVPVTALRPHATGGMSHACRAAESEEGIALAGACTGAVDAFICREGDETLTALGRARLGGGRTLYLSVVVEEPDDDGGHGAQVYAQVAGPHTRARWASGETWVHKEGEDVVVPIMQLLAEPGTEARRALRISGSVSC